MVTSIIPANAVVRSNGVLITSSITVAKAFGKRHSDILRVIKNLECSKSFTERNFALSEYKDSTGRTLPQFEITKDGFIFLIMGFTGKKADAIKEAYINAFNQMAEALKQQGKTSSYDRTCLRDAINMLVAKKGLIYSDAYSFVHQRFGVNHIEQLTAEQLPQAVEYVHRMTLEGEWMAPAELPSPAVEQQFTCNELYQLSMLWHRAEMMRRSMEQVYPLLRVAEHRLASQYYEMYRLFKLDIDSSQRLLARETAKTQLP